MTSGMTSNLGMAKPPPIGYAGQRWYPFTGSLDNQRLQSGYSSLEPCHNQPILAARNVASVDSETVQHKLVRDITHPEEPAFRQSPRLPIIKDISPDGKRPSLQLSVSIEYQQADLPSRIYLECIRLQEAFEVLSA